MFEFYFSFRTIYYFSLYSKETKLWPSTFKDNCQHLNFLNFFIFRSQTTKICLRVNLMLWTPYTKRTVLQTQMNGYIIFQNIETTNLRSGMKYLQTSPPLPLVILNIYNYKILYIIITTYHEKINFYIIPTKATSLGERISRMTA